MSSYFRPNIDAMAGYVPGEQPKPGTRIIKLNTNENPYPPSPAAMDVLRNFDGEWLRRYPNPFANEFRQAISEVLQVPMDWIMAGNGSDEILNVIVRSCAEQQRKVVYPTPTYVLYRTLAEMQPAEVVEVPYGENNRLPIDELVAANGAVTFIASPNSPSGHVVSNQELRQLASQLTGVLLIDEAYVDFADSTALPLVQEFENVMISRTLSKGYSLAGLRLGFGIANPKLLSGLFKVKDSYNIDAIACAVGAAAMRDQPYLQQCIAQVKACRAQLTVDLKQLGFQVPDSQTNFLLARPPKGNAEAIYLALKERGILVRYFKQLGLDDKLRITVGTEEQNQILIEALLHLI
ncbi:histidinol-phosphate transaminase [Leptolyngbya sp. NK1-12]|uniref:Histidinol-phosphate aminotransferase n=1 Tax=Leptolyngbya sp. NK1-12 TaxID=2547451 RepID=A0AA96WHG7_9CYAN|nr:histidinol-phosphate transaminase [Leptolyngbya sp. NK1-12]MBF2048749.1 histidinol-phosphate transaminase [Elainella sp. C42_A2020_010]WNZ25363.1 histidinol-phosphate transaminase [Leptolyngbya sp. NK1-12]